jgi:hypothetical protein
MASRAHETRSKPTKREKKLLYTHRCSSETSFAFRQQQRRLPGADNPEGFGVESRAGVLEGVGGKGTGTRM